MSLSRRWLACQSTAAHFWKDVRETGSSGNIWLKSVKKGWSTVWCDPKSQLDFQPTQISGFNLCKLVSQNVPKLRQMRCFKHRKWPTFDFKLKRLCSTQKDHLQASYSSFLTKRLNPLLRSGNAAASRNRIKNILTVRFQAEQVFECIKWIC